jgi:regulator of PEP synthase PpsR (kinase-PPPase family)
MPPVGDPFMSAVSSSLSPSAGALSPPRAIFVVSDATGETAEKVVRAALSQFEIAEVDIDLRVFPHLRHEHDVDTVVREAQTAHALLVSTLVRTEERELLFQRCREHSVPCVDLLGSLLGSLAGFFGVQPRGIPGLLHAVSTGYFRRMEAIEFTVHSDDGREPDALLRADLVLVGVSRTSKTPLSIYLAQKGLKVANVPVVLDVPPPPQLAEVAPERVFALTIQPEALLAIRRQRLLRLHMDLLPDMSYGQREHILREIYFARSLFASHPGWTVVDITGKAIEETAADILRAFSAWQGRLAHHPPHTDSTK